MAFFTYFANYTWQPILDFESAKQALLKFSVGLATVVTVTEVTVIVVTVIGFTVLTLTSTFLALFKTFLAHANTFLILANTFLTLDILHFKTFYLTHSRS